jgi:hypothetical protein
MNKNVEGSGLQTKTAGYSPTGIAGPREMKRASIYFHDCLKGDLFLCSFRCAEVAGEQVSGSSSQPQRGEGGEQILFEQIKRAGNPNGLPALCRKKDQLPACLRIWSAK